MGWRDNRRRSICRKIMFTPEEWEQVQEVRIVYNFVGEIPEIAA